MATKPIFEYDAKRLISEHFDSASVSGQNLENRFKAIHIDKDSDFEKLRADNPLGLVGGFCWL